MKNKIISAIIGIVAGIANGLFGSGGGTIVVPAMERFLKIPPQKAHATAIAIILPLSIVSVFVYLKNSEIDWWAALAVSIGGMIGGFIGARLLKKIPNKWLHRIFGLFMIAAAVKMII